MDGGAPEEGFPGVMVPQQEELSPLGEMPGMEADPSLFRLLSWKIDSASLMRSPEETGMRPQRLAEDPRDALMLPLRGRPAASFRPRRRVFVWDSCSQTMQKEELDTVYKSKDLL